MSMNFSEEEKEVTALCITRCIMGAVAIMQRIGEDYGYDEIGKEEGEGGYAEFNKFMCSGHENIDQDDFEQYMLATMVQDITETIIMLTEKMIGENWHDKYIDAISAGCSNKISSDFTKNIPNVVSLAEEIIKKHRGGEA